MLKVLSYDSPVLLASFDADTIINCTPQRPKELNITPEEASPA